MADQTETERRPHRCEDLAWRTYAEEAVILAPRQNIVRMLNPVGSRIWALIDGTRRPDEIAYELTQEYPVDLPTAQTSVDRFIAQLGDRQLIEWRA